MIKLSYYAKNSSTSSIEFTVNDDVTLEELLSHINCFIKSAGFPIKDNYDLTFVNNTPQQGSEDEAPDYTFNLGDVEDPHLYAQMHIQEWSKKQGTSLSYSYILDPDERSYGYKVTVLPQEC